MSCEKHGLDDRAQDVGNNMSRSSHGNHHVEDKMDLQTMLRIRLYVTVMMAQRCIVTQ